MWARSACPPTARRRSQGNDLGWNRIRLSGGDVARISGPPRISGERVAHGREPPWAGTEQASTAGGEHEYDTLSPPTQSNLYANLPFSSC